MQKSKLSVSLLVLSVVMVTGSLLASPPTMPDAGSSALLLSIGFAGVAAVRRFMR